MIKLRLEILMQEIRKKMGNNITFTSKVIIINWVFLSISFSFVSAEKIKFIHSLDECIKMAEANSLIIKKSRKDLISVQYGYAKALKDLWGIKVDLNLTPKSYKFFDEPIIIPQEVEISEAEASKYKNSHAWRAGVPVTKLFLTGARVTLETKIDKDVLKGELEGKDASYESFQKPNIEFKLDQPFFVFKKNPYQRILKNIVFTLEIAKETFNSARENLVYQIKNVYFSCLLINEKVKIQKEVVEQAKTLYNIVHAKLKAGRISEIDLIQAEIQLEKAKESLLGTIDDYEIECKKLKSIIGLPQEIKIELIDELDYKVQKVNFDEVLLSALNTSSIIKEMERKLKIDEMNLEKVKEKDKPEIGLIIDYGYQDKRIEGTMYDSTLVNTKESNRWDVRLNFNWPIYDSGVVKAEVKEYETKVEAERLDILIQKEKIRIDFQETLNKIKMAERQIASLDKMIKQAESLVHIANIRYREGIGLITEVIQAQKVIADLKFKKKESIFNLMLAMAALEKLKVSGER
ncbi:MAG: TolC family protein [bacterium]